MDYSQYYRQEKHGFSVYFPNRKGLDKKEITEIFSQFGSVLSVNEAGDQFGLRFVRYQTLEEVIACLEGMRNHKLIKLSVQNKNYQAAKSTKKYNKPKSNNGELSALDETTKHFQIDENLCMNKSNISNSQMFENESYINASIAKDNVKIPALVCTDELNRSTSESSLSSSIRAHRVARTPKIISASEVVVANIPAALSVHYILHLFRKHNPISVSFMTHINGTSLQYCHVYFRKSEQAIAIEEEFDNFLISGHSLIVLRPNKLLEEILSF